MHCIFVIGLAIFDKNKLLFLLSLIPLSGGHFNCHLLKKILSKQVKNVFLCFTFLICISLLSLWSPEFSSKWYKTKENVTKDLKLKIYQTQISYSVSHRLPSCLILCSSQLPQLPQNLLLWTKIDENASKNLVLLFSRFLMFSLSVHDHRYNNVLLWNGQV